MKDHQKDSGDHQKIWEGRSLAGRGFAASREAALACWRNGYHPLWLPERPPVQIPRWFRSGNLIESHSGSQAKAVHEGKVGFLRSGLRGYGQLVIINHGEGYHSLYGVYRDFDESWRYNKRTADSSRVGNSGLVNLPACISNYGIKGSPLIQWVAAKEIDLEERKYGQEVDEQEDNPGGLHYIRCASAGISVGRWQSPLSAPR